MYHQISSDLNKTDNLTLRVLIVKPRPARQNIRADRLMCSTHSFPYISAKLQALHRIHTMLNPAGKIIIVQGNTQNLYDKIFYLGVKLTVSHAEYLSTQKLSEMMKTAGLTATGIIPLPRKWFIPSIYLLEGMRK